MNLINSNKKNYINFGYYILLTLPISLVLSRFAADLSVVILTILFFVINEEKKIFENKFVILGFFLIFFSAISSILSNNVIFSLKSSLLHLRFIYFILVISILFYYLKNNFLKNIFNVIIVCYVALFFDATIQFFFKENIFGYTVNPITRVSSFFFDELILGSYLARLFPVICFFYIYLKLRINIFLIISFLIYLYFVVLITGERLSFLILNIYYSLIIPFCIKKKILKIILFFLPMIGLVVVLTFMNNFSSRNSFNEIIDQSTKKNYNICKETLYSIKSNKKLTKRWNVGENINIQQINDGVYQGYIPNCYPIMKIFGSEIYNIFSVMHFNHYLTAIEIFKDNKLIGIGPKNFRNICKNKNYYLNKFSCSTHPHNYLLQILAETGLIGSSIFLFIYLSFFYLLIFNFLTGNNKNFLSKHILISCFLVNLFPIFPSGNIFNNWNAIVYSLPLGFLLSLYRIKN
tara:strand:- start:1420 stop:2808 length:1389 start_codon:yes stop_codon:yes gene_type:complete